MIRSLGHYSIVLMFLFSVLLPTPLLAVETAVRRPSIQRMSLDYTNADLPLVLKSIAYSYDLNLVISENVQGKVSAQLNNISLDEVLQAILNVNGYGFSRRDNVVYILPKEEVDLVTETLPMSYQQAKQAKDLVLKLLSPRGDIKVNELTNSLVVMDHADNLQKVKDVLAQIDQAPVQVLIEARIVDISTKDIEKIGTQINATYTSPGSSHISSTELKVGSSTKDADGGQVKLIPRFSNLAADVTVDALIQKHNGRVLAAPSIATLSGQEASITIADRYPYKEQVMTGDGNISTSSSTTQFVEVGTKLRVTPMVSPDGWITMKVHPEVSSVLEIPTDSAPQVSTREADATIRVKDNETIVIGGLISKTSDVQRNGVPGLSSLPVVGWLFKRHTDDVRQSEMMVFITPHIMPSPQKAGVVVEPLAKSKVMVDKSQLHAGKTAKSVSEKEVVIKPKAALKEDAGLMSGLLSYADSLEKDALKKGADNIYIKLELIKTYKIISEQFPQSSKAEFCLYKIASIYVKDFAKCDAARESLGQLKKNFPGSLYIATTQRIVNECAKAPVVKSEKISTVETKK